MEYNTQKSHLVMPEYGRNVQSMAEYLLTIEDPAQRLRNAEAVVDLMSILNPHLRNVEDYRHKLWDHLHQMTDFKLEVEGPYPPPTPEELRKKPEVLPYPHRKIEHRHFGKNIEALLERAMKEENPEKRQGYTQHIGYFMKLAYTNWHQEPVHDDMIRNELAQMSGGLLQYEPGGFKVQFDPRIANGFKQSKKKKNNNNQGGNRNFNNQGGNNNKYKKFKNKNKGMM